MGKLLSSACVLAAAAAVTLLPRMAFATPDFPAAMATDLGVACAPQCTVCHTTNSGGAGTVTQPFGRQMQIYGLVKYDQASLASALQQMTSNNIDSNCNGTIDTDELKACQDPNANVQCDGGTGNLGDVVIYGCDASPAGPGSAAAAIAALLLGGMLARRIRRRA
jgi:MYXO-CTERM domain-containing protein